MRAGAAFAAAAGFVRLLGRGHRGSQRLHQVAGRSGRNGLGQRDLLAGELRLEQAPQRRAVLAVQLRRIERRRQRRDDLLGEIELGALHRRCCDGLVDLGVLVHILVDEERLQRERVAHGTDQAQLLLAGQDESPERRDTAVLHRSEQQDVRPPRGFGGCGDEVVRAVEVHRIDLADLDEAADLDRARRVALLDRLELGVLDGDELALRDLPAADELVGADVALVHRAPALLLDRRPALAVQHAERDVRLPGRGFGGRREPHRDVHEAEAD